MSGADCFPQSVNSCPKSGILPGRSLLLALRTVFFGSPEEAIPALTALVSAGHEVRAVYTRPDRPAGRSRRLAPTPVRVAAEGLGLRVETPSSLRGARVVADLAETGADLFVVVAYGRILPPEALRIPRLGAVNIHPSLLPRYRGPSPVATAVLEGATETGVTLMLLNEGMDTGPVLAQSEPVQLSGSERTGGLTAALFRKGADMLPAVLAGLENGSIRPRPQDNALATVTRLIEKEDGRIDWTRTAAETERAVRAYNPWPGAFTTWQHRTLKMLAASVCGEASDRRAPGAVRVVDRRILVATGMRELELLTVQLEGRNAVTAADFLNGNPSISGAVLGVS